MELAIIIAVSIVVVIFLTIMIMSSLWRKVPQDKALVVTGLRKRVLTGKGGFIVPMLERTDRISLENIKIDIRTDGALTEQGVDIVVDGVTVIKVKSDEESIYAAMEQFNTGNEAHTIQVIKETARDVLEGKLREIISKMTVEEIYKDREKFASQVQDVAALDLAEMGLEIKAFTIRDIGDKNGYLEALGKPRIASVKRDAEIAEAEAKKETKIKTSEATRQGEEARLVSETQIAEAAKEKELKVQAYRKEQESSRAIADLAYQIEENKVKKEVTETEMQVEILKMQKQIEIAEQEALRREKELDATVIKDANARKYETEKDAEAKKFKDVTMAEAESQAIKLRSGADAEAIKLRGFATAEIEAQTLKLKAEAEAEAIKLRGQAEAESIRLRGNAEAETMEKKAEAYKLYNDAALTQMIIEKMPDIARAISDPLSKVEKIVIVDDKGASKVPGYVTDIMSKLPESVNALTGVDITKILKKFTGDDNSAVLPKNEVKD